jgi:hypothetical protein
MKHLLSTALVTGFIFSASLTHVMANDGRMAYNTCMTHVFTQAPINLSEKFPQMNHAKQAQYCIDFLKKKRPDLLQGLDLDEFEEGFADGRFRHDD